MRYLETWMKFHILFDSTAGVLSMESMLAWAEFDTPWADAH